MTNSNSSSNSTGQPESVLECQSLTKKYGSKTALDAVSLTVSAGEIVGLVGRNGAGKTTLMKLVNGLSRPTSGSLSLFGSSRQLEEARHHLGTIIETPGFFPSFNALDNLRYFALIRGFSQYKEEADFRPLLDLVHLWEDRKKPFRKYSLGMKQRLGIALAFMGDPTFMVLDEPVNALDPEGIADFRAELKRRVAENKISVLISSHILAELQSVADRFYLIEKGQLKAEISTDQLRQQTDARLTLKLDNPQQALSLLSENSHLLAPLADKDFKPSLSENGELSLPGDYPLVPDLVRFLVEKGFDLYQIQNHQLSLEDYFLKMIRGGEDL